MLFPLANFYDGLRRQYVRSFQMLEWGVMAPDKTAQLESDQVELLPAARSQAAVCKGWQVAACSLEGVGDR